MEILAILGGGKTKPNKANFNFTAESAELAEQKGICVNGCSIKKYDLHLTSLRS